MSIGVFSEFQNITSGYQSSPQVNKAPQMVSNPVSASNPPVPSVQVKEPDKKEKVLNTIKAIAPYAIPLIAIPVTAGITYKLSTKQVSALKGEISNLAREVATVKQNAQTIGENLTKQAQTATKSDAKIWSAILAIAGLGGSFKAGQLSSDEKDVVVSKVGEKVDSIHRNSASAVGTANQALAASGIGLNSKYMSDISGIKLLDNNNSLHRNEQKYKQALSTIRSEANKHLFVAPNVKPITSTNSSLWSVTSEFAPIKEGGLGSVPVELQNNITKLGIKTPAFIPMYKENGYASFREENGKYYYKYGNKEYQLDSVASFPMEIYRNNKAETRQVELYVNNSTDENGNNKQLIFVKMDDYFDGTIYQPGIKSEEEEKFAVFSKAVYEFAKAKFDLYSVKDLKINKEAFDSIPTPDGLILNDWQASPIAALARYKAPMENAYGQMTDEAAKQLQEMRILTIGHNAMYQGSTQCNNNDVQRQQSTSNILNTLFDSYAYDIVSNAKSDARKTDPYDEGLKNLDNVLLLNANNPAETHTNLLNMGICLSDYFCPVSKNYAQEIISDDHPELAGELRWALSQKTDVGAVVGVINGNDFNNLSLEAKKGFIKNHTGIEFKNYDQHTKISDIMDYRLQNKINLYNDYMIPFSQKNDSSIQTDEVKKIRTISSRLEFVEGEDKTELPRLTPEEIAKTPFISLIGRLVTQKGMEKAAGAIKMLYDNWETDFPGKEKPIFYIGGQDGENGKQRKFIEDLKNVELSQEDSNRVVFAHGFAPMTPFTAASDLFLLPSIFEPCGLTQGESFAVGTPVIASAVGGIVDTVNRNGKENGILTNKNQPVTSKALYEALKKGLKIYFDHPEQYQKMVQDSINEDFSWIQHGKQGSIFEYLELFGYNKDALPDVA